MLKSLQIGVLKGKHGAWCFHGLVASTNINEEAYIKVRPVLIIIKLIESEHAPSVAALHLKNQKKKL